MSYIEKEAQKNQTTVDIIKEEFSKSLPNSSIDTNNLGNLLGATTSAFANLMELAQSTPQGKAISIAVTTANGTIINYGINVSKDGENSLKAVFTSGTGAVVSVGVAEGLSVLAGRILATVGIGAVTAAGAPVAVTVAAGAAVVGASYLVGNYASHYAGMAWDYFFGEKLEARDIKETNTFEINTTLNPQELINNERIKEYIESSDEFIIIDDNTNTSYTITDTTDNLVIRNAIDIIPEVSFLLSNISIKVDERLDLGEKGIYTVKSGDTFSQIANNNGFTTQELLKINTWLIDDNRLSFNQDKILIETSYLNLNNLDHTLIGTSTDDILIDHNGGNDTFIAGAGTNYIDGGEGSDTVSYKHMINSNKEGININLSLATAQAINSTITDTLVSIENVIGSRYDDNIIGKDDSDTTLYGGAGDDRLRGGNNSTNKIYGDDGDDYIVGGKTTDEIMLEANRLVSNHLYGGIGNDTLIAGVNANNYLYGGDGDDTLVSTMIGFKNESVDYSKGSSYLNGGVGFDTYAVKDYVTIEDDDGKGEIETKYGKLSSLEIKELSNGTILLLKNNPIYVNSSSSSNPFAGYGSGAFATILGNFSQTSSSGMLLDNYEAIFKIVKDGNDLIITDFDVNKTQIRIKNYSPMSLGLNITQIMLDKLTNSENQNPTPTVQINGTDESETLIGNQTNNIFNSNKGDDTLKDVSGGNDTYKFKKGDGNDIVYDIKGDDTILFDESVSKSDVTFFQSEDLKSLIIKYSPTDSITIQNYFDNFSKIENIKLANGEKLNPEFSLQTILKDTSVNQTMGYGNDEIRKVA
ncbi:LysM peptidoglycan-binding domain-containing protein [Arcobacter vandammei]|uniref:LysM peptidoglycan-binding domain-containing protein n=1 Tax=Arcobacter vandammei TaxID=2782243 RepID=UPI0018DF6CAE|nr:LysM peptidoglycan-binding domain-containing protein [Arcobacter vandammei]